MTIFAPQIIVRRTPRVVTTAAGTTWNPSDKDANATLSNGNLTIATSAGGDWYSARSVAALTSNQKCYYEIVVDGESFSIHLGFAKATKNLHQLVGVESPTLSCGNASADTVYRDADSGDNGSTALSSNPGVGANVSVAFDSGAQKIWFRVNGGNWNNSGAADPAGNTGGFSVSFSGPYYAIGGVQAAGDQVTAKFSSSSWTYTAPTGFTQLSA